MLLWNISLHKPRPSENMTEIVGIKFKTNVIQLIQFYIHSVTFLFHYEHFLFLFANFFVREFFCSVWNTVCFIWNIFCSWFHATKKKKKNNNNKDSFRTFEHRSRSKSVNLLKYCVSAFWSLVNIQAIPKTIFWTWIKLKW